MVGKYIIEVELSVDIEALISELSASDDTEKVNSEVFSGISVEAPTENITMPYGRKRRYRGLGTLNKSSFLLCRPHNLIVLMQLCGRRQ